VRVTRWRHETAPNPARVGEYVDRAGTLHGFLRERDGSVTTIDAPGASATAAYDIDDHGRIAGAYADAGLVVRGFVREPDGEFTTIDVPDAAPAGAADTAASGINNQGQIVGSYSDAAGVQHGFVLDDGMFTTVDAPDAPGDTGVTDIDDGGRLVGVYGLVKYDYLLDERGKFSALDVPGVVSQAIPTGLNNQGQIVGYSDEDRARSFHGFPRDKRGRYRRIDVPGGTGTAPTRINDDGQIVGFYSDSSNAQDLRGFLVDRGKFTRIDVPGAQLTQPNGFTELTPRGVPTGSLATDIDDHGRVIGFIL
jgi:probable HAF family extracellular repeat protein